MYDYKYWEAKVPENVLLVLCMIKPFILTKPGVAFNKIYC